MTLGEKIKVLREDCKLSIEEFSKKLNVDAKTLTDWESNIVEPNNDDIQRVVDLVTEIRKQNETAESNETKAEAAAPAAEQAAEQAAEKNEEAAATGGKGPVLGTCIMCGHEVHKYDKYSQYRKNKKDIFVCDECDKERRKDPKFRRILRLINWLTYSTYLYIAVALCCVIIYFVDKHMELIYTVISLSLVILIQITASFFIMRKHNV